MTTKINYKQNSFYRETEIKDFYLDIWTPIYISESRSDVKIEIPMKYHKRPDLLSADVYNSPYYWWVFALRNMNELVDPINDFKSGLTIYIPSLKNIKDDQII